MSDDPPLDLHQVAVDDEAIEQLRRRSVTPDPALVLLRDLLADVDVDLPGHAPVGRGSTVLTLAGEQVPERRLARSGAVVALFTAGIVSLGGVAAASVLVPADNPLHGLGETVRAVVAAVAPPKPSPSPEPGPAGPHGSGVLTPRPLTPTAPPEVAQLARVSSLPGAGISSAARAHAAARQSAVRQAARQAAAARAADASTSHPAPKGGSGVGRSGSQRPPAEQPTAVEPQPPEGPRAATRPAPDTPRLDRRVTPLGKPAAQLSRTPSMKPRA